MFVSLVALENGIFCLLEGLIDCRLEVLTGATALLDIWLPRRQEEGFTNVNAWCESLTSNGMSLFSFILYLF